MATQTSQQKNERGDDQSESEIPKRFYALYSYVLKSRERVDDDSFPERDHEDQDESPFSLAVAATTLSAQAETELRKTLTGKLTKNTPIAGQGKFFSIGLDLSPGLSNSALCYYCIMESGLDLIHLDHFASEETTNPGTKPDEQDKEQFVVCFISFQDSSLDLFRPELDSYVHGLSPLLDKELTQLSPKIQHYLEKWPEDVLEFLSRTIQLMGQNLQQLIYAALVNASLQITSATKEQEDDIRRFYKCCSLSSLMEQLQPGQTSVTDSGDSSDLWLLQPIIVSISLNEDSVTFDKSYTCQFCKNASDKLLNQDLKNITKIRDFLESIKLAFVHNLNKSKRFLKQAEVDHYALHRLLSFLKRCGCGTLLLQYVKLEGGQESLSVLSALETFVRDVGLTLS